MLLGLHGATGVAGLALREGAATMCSLPSHPKACFGASVRYVRAVMRPLILINGGAFFVRKTYRSRVTSWV
jgi:hypothetical protein